uniref:Uncharacterized protein n=1 Tax=viral metagenome TaxID=1070528 RepID=A0A6M3LQJ1_9ZZZZ
MEDDILEQDEDLIEEEMRVDTETKKAAQSKKVQPKPDVIEQVEETFEGFHQAERLGIVNTLTGEVIDGFDPKRDEGLVKLGKVILNQLNKISIASGV